MQSGALRVPVRSMSPTDRKESNVITMNRKQERRCRWNSYSRSDDLYRLSVEEKIRWDNSRVQGKKQLELIAAENRFRAKRSKARSEKRRPANLEKEIDEQDESSRKGFSGTSSTQAIFDDINNRLECLTLFIDVNKRAKRNANEPELHSPYSVSSSTEAGFQRTNYPNNDQVLKSEPICDHCESSTFDQHLPSRDPEVDSGECSLNSRSEECDTLNSHIANLDACEKYVDVSQRSAFTILSLKELGESNKEQLGPSGSFQESEQMQENKNDHIVSGKDELELDQTSEISDVSSVKNAVSSIQRIGNPETSTRSRAKEKVFSSEKAMKTMQSSGANFIQSPQAPRKSISSTDDKPLASREIIKNSISAILSISVGKEDEWSAPCLTR